MNGSPGRKICVQPMGGAEHDERCHRPPARSQKSGHRKRHFVVGIGVKAGMGLRQDGEVIANFQIEQQLIGVKVFSETAKRRPLQITFWRWSKVSVEEYFAVAL